MSAPQEIEKESPESAPRSRSRNATGTGSICAKKARGVDVEALFHFVAFEFKNVA
jgi:hypothetical protein